MPFFIGDSQLLVTVDDEPIAKDNYRRENNYVVLNYPAPEGSLIRISRKTTLSDSTLKLVLEELQTELADRENDLISLGDELQKQISAGDKLNEEYATALFRRIQDKIQSNAQGFNETVDSITARLDARITSAAAAAGSRSDWLNQSINEQSQSISELGMSLKSELSSNTAALSSGIESLNNYTDVLQGEIDTLKSRLKSLESSQSKARSVPLISTPAVNSAEISRLTELMEQTRSALNFETQVRRREDAQIKALLKRLLEKYERLEDFIAGSGDLPETIISELRRESRLHDDKLGRTALRLITLTEDLKEKHN